MATKFFTPNEQWPAPGAAVSQPADDDTLVLYSTRITKADYLRIKEAAYWVPGFTEQAFVQLAIREQLASLGEQVKPLPPLVLQELVKRNKKMQK